MLVLVAAVLKKLALVVSRLALQFWACACSHLIGQRPPLAGLYRIPDRTLSSCSPSDTCRGCFFVACCFACCERCAPCSCWGLLRWGGYRLRCHRLHPRCGRTLSCWRGLRRAEVRRLLADRSDRRWFLCWRRALSLGRPARWAPHTSLAFFFLLSCFSPCLYLPAHAISNKVCTTCSLQCAAASASLWGCCSAAPRRRRLGPAAGSLSSLRLPTP